MHGLGCRDGWLSQASPWPAQINSLIGEMKVNAEGSPQLQAADPLLAAVERIKSRADPRGLECGSS